MPTAILVDGGFFIKRYRHLYQKHENHTSKLVAKNLYDMCLKHLASKDGKTHRSLYRIFFYDCPPITKKAHHPLTNKAIDYSKTSESIFRQELHQELKKLRKVALRLGYLSNPTEWIIKPAKTKDLLHQTLTINDLAESDIIYNIKQKGVDMKIGLDIASLAYKKLVNQIILIAGDSDFVPAAKLARREGIDFILDPMWHPINPDLHEHIDGLMSIAPAPIKSSFVQVLIPHL